MSTKPKDTTTTTTSHGKEKQKTSSSPSNIQHNTIFLSHGRKPSPKSSSLTGSPDRIFPSDKPIPNYLKPTQSSSRDSSLSHGTIGKKPSGSGDIGIGSPRTTTTTSRRKNLDKSVSQIQPTKKLTRTLSSSSRESAKERSLIKPSSPSPKATYHPIKPLTDKVASSPRSSTDRLTIKHVSQKPSLAQAGRTSSSKALKVAESSTHIPKTKILKRTTSNVSSKKVDTKDSNSPTSTTTTITTTTTCTDVVEIVGIHEEDKAILEQVIQPDALMIEEEEIHFELPLDHEQKIAIMQVVDHIEPDHADEVADHHESFDTTMEIEEHDVHSPQVEDISDEKTIDQIQVEEHHEDEDEDKLEHMNINENEDSGESSHEQSHVEVKEAEDEDSKADEKEVNEEELAVKPPVITTKAVAEDELETNMSPPPGTENLVLRKQDVNKGKKEAKAYNDVIEETTSKLLTRKNKVLALAGAFETVISLQHHEPGQGQ